MIANGIFLSKLVYLIPLWGGCESFLLRALQTIQNKAARVVTNQGIFTSTKVLLRECGWLSVAQLVFFHSVVLLFKTRLTKKPRYLFEMAEIQENTRYGTRTSHERKTIFSWTSATIKSIKLEFLSVEISPLMESLTKGNEGIGQCVRV